MKKFYHIIITSHNEVMFRNEEDFLHGINSLAITAIRTDSRIGTFSLMSDHIHATVYTENPSSFVSRFRRSYINYFNPKYKRSGRLGDRGFYCVEIKGPAHIETCNSYVLRNSVHHGITHTPYGYSFNSSKCYFAKQLGHSYLSDIDFSKYRTGAFLPPNNRPDKSLILNRTGIIAPESFIEIALTEKQFVSARGYNFCMTRFSGEEWEKAQEKDGNGMKPVTLNDIEMPYSLSIGQMLENERGRFNEDRLHDIDICEIIDGIWLRKYGVESYVALTNRQKATIYGRLICRKGCSKAQIARCLALQDR